MSDQALLVLDKASVHFGSVAALHDVSLTLQRGERLLLVGANGSGKTTLLRLLHGLVPHQGRREWVGGLAGAAQVPVAAMVFQRPFLMHCSAWRNVWLGLWLHGWPRATRSARCDEALRRVGLGALGGRPARVLSGGQQQRLALARAWAVRPRVLFLDEPTASLDPGAKREVEQLITEFAQEGQALGLALVMSTHNQGQAKRLATRVLYLEGGRVIVDLPTADFFNQALPEAAAQFVKGELPWHV